MANAWSNAKQTAETTWNNIKSSVTGAFDNLKSSLSNTANNIKSDMSGAWNTLSSTTVNAWNGLKNSVSNLWTNLKSNLSQTNWSSVGSNLVSGIYSGIQSGWSWLVSTARSLASNMLSAAKAALGIRSPSKAFAEVGKFVDLGLIEGIDGSENAVLKTVSNLANSVTDEFEADQPALQIGAEGDGLVSRLSGIAVKLSDIAAVFHDINTMLTGMGGLHIPAIAEGTAIPYKTRIADDGDVFESKYFADFSSGLDERLFDLNNRLKLIFDRVERISSKMLDQDELASSIARAQSREVRGYGW